MFDNREMLVPPSEPLLVRYRDGSSETIKNVVRVEYRCEPGRPGSNGWYIVNFGAHQLTLLFNDTTQRVLKSVREFRIGKPLTGFPG